MITWDDREAYGELRLQSLAFWRDRVVFIVWTDRDQGPHVISCRYLISKLVQPREFGSAGKVPCGRRRTRAE